MRAFIMHGGISSTMESIYCGVPIIVIPFLGDQFSNAALIQEKEFGIKMRLNEATVEKIVQNLETVMSDEYVISFIKIQIVNVVMIVVYSYFSLTLGGMIEYAGTHNGNQRC